MNGSILRTTRSVCPECLREIEANVIQRQEKVYLEKKCGVHGNFSLYLSGHADYYRGLSEFYFPLMERSLPQRDYIAHLTNKCELNCPICLADANSDYPQDYPLEDLKEFLKGKRGFKIDLMGAEPATRNDLPEIIRAIKRSGNISALHTNGIKIADPVYLTRLKNEGLNEVHLQFDGFSDEVYEKIRGRALLSVKERALENLEKSNIATDLVATIVRGVNEDQMTGIVDFGIRHRFVKEVFFLGCRFLGKAKDLSIEQCMMPDELIDLLQSQTAGVISRDNIFKFQKIYFSLLAAFSVRKCFYINHFLLVRAKNGYIPIDKIIDLDGIEEHLEKFKKMKSAKNSAAVPYLVFILAAKAFFSGNISGLIKVLSYGLPFIKGFDLARISGETLLLGFISACDAYSFDHTVARNCGKGALSSNLGVQESGAIDNILRDKMAGGYR